MVQLFSFDSYKAYLKQYVNEHRRAGLVADLARGAGCDRTYFSQVLNGKAQLTADHAVNLSEYFQFNDNEQEYFLLLVLYERAANEQAKRRLRAMMTRIEIESSVLAKKIVLAEKPGELSDEMKAQYYASWLWSAVHIATSVTSLQTPEALSEKFLLPVERVHMILQQLNEMGLVSTRNGQHVHTGANIHVPNSSPFSQMNHLNWRTKALEKAATQEGTHYTTTFAITKVDEVRLKRQLLEFVEQQRDLVRKSGSEEVFCFCCDLFAVS